MDQEQENLQKMEEESKKELEEIKLTLETKKGDIIDYIINNIMKVNMEFPEMVKKRFVKKKKIMIKIIKIIIILQLPLLHLEGKPLEQFQYLKVLKMIQK